jgi:hypothetical protein
LGWYLEVVDNEKYKIGKVIFGSETSAVIFMSLLKMNIPK